MAALQSPSTLSTALTFDYGQSTDQGSRSRNEDASLAYPTDEGVVVMVADGMGSGLDGQIFSKRAVERAQMGMLAAVDLLEHERVAQAMEAAAEELHRMRANDERYSRSGSTLVLASLSLQPEGVQAIVSYVGDSRAYVVRADGHTQAITVDHSYTQQLIKEGVDEGAAFADAQGALLTHVLGQALDSAIIRESTSTHTLGPEDRLILCSDGISKVIAQRDLAKFVLGRPAQEAADTLVRYAVRDKGTQGRDNATVIVVRCRSTAAHVAALPRRRGGLGMLLAVGLLVAALTVGALLFFPGIAPAAPPDTRSSPISEETVSLPPTLSPTLVPTESQQTQAAPTSTNGPSVTPTVTASNTPTATPTATNTSIPPTRVPPTRVPPTSVSLPVITPSTVTTTPQGEPPSSTPVPGADPNIPVASEIPTNTATVENTATLTPPPANDAQPTADPNVPPPPPPPSPP